MCSLRTLPRCTNSNPRVVPREPPLRPRDRLDCRASGPAAKRSSRFPRRAGWALRGGKLRSCGVVVIVVGAPLIDAELACSRAPAARGGSQIVRETSPLLQVPFSACYIPRWPAKTSTLWHSPPERQSGSQLSCRLSRSFAACARARPLALPRPLLSLCLRVLCFLFSLITEEHIVRERRVGSDVTKGGWCPCNHQWDVTSQRFCFGIIGLVPAGRCVLGRMR